MNTSHPMRSPTIDLVRFGAAAVVVGGHFFSSGVLPVYRYPALAQQAITWLFQNALYGVTAFFVVSGFLITQMLVGPLKTLDEMDIRSFYVKRASRILPLFLVIVAIAVPVSFLPRAEDPGYYNPFASGPGGYSIAFVASLATFTFNWFIILKKQVWQIGIQWALLWSLAVEEQFYFLYPWVVRGARTRERLAWILGSVVLSGFLFRLGVFIWAPGRFDLSHNASFSVFDQLAIGCLSYLAFEKIRSHPHVGDLQGGSIACLGLVLFSVVYLRTQSANTAQNILAPTFLSVGCGMFILGGLLSNLDRRPFLRLLSFPGRLSYGLYLWHCLILMTLWPWITQAGRWIGPLLFVLAVFLWAEVSYRLFETPANRFIRRTFGLQPSQSL